MMSQCEREDESRSVLKVCTDASLDDIKRAYRREGFRSHPVGNQEDTRTDDANMQFRRVHSAYVCLKGVRLQGGEQPNQLAPK